MPAEESGKTAIRKQAERGAQVAGEGYRGTVEESVRRFCQVSSEAFVAVTVIK